MTATTAAGNREIVLNLRTLAMLATLITGVSGTLSFGAFYLGQWFSSGEDTKGAIKKVESSTTAQLAQAKVESDRQFASLQAQLDTIRNSFNASLDTVRTSLNGTTTQVQLLQQQITSLEATSRDVNNLQKDVGDLKVLLASVQAEVKFLHTLLDRGPDGMDGRGSPSWAPSPGRR